MKYQNQKGEVIETTGKTATTCDGTLFIWVRCQNGAVVSITQKQLEEEFTSIPSSVEG